MDSEESEPSWTSSSLRAGGSRSFAAASQAPAFCRRFESMTTQVKDQSVICRDGVHTHTHTRARGPAGRGTRAV